MFAAILTSSIRATVNKLSSLFSEGASSSAEPPPSSAEQKLLDLKDTMMRIQAKLDDAEESDIDDRSEQLRLRELREVSYAAEDVVDEYEYDVLRAKVGARRQAMKNRKHDTGDEVFDLNSYHPKVPISDDLAYKVKEIRKRFITITDDWHRINLNEKCGKTKKRKWEPVETSSCVDVSRIFGREDEKEKVIKWLLEGDEQNSSHKVSVISVVGMGGLGKTTLAQLAYNDMRVCQHFDLKGWVCVSESFNVVDLIRKIIISFYPSPSTNDEVSKKSLDGLYNFMKEKLRGKRFLLVLDDVWNQKLELWDSLKAHLTNAGTGKVIVTTRNEPVAKIMQTTPPINLGILSPDNCLSLFKNIVFDGQDHNLHQYLLHIAKQIIDKCQGLPLAVKVIASILRNEVEVDEWVDILKSNLWELDEEKSYILPALRLSYDRMPIELKPCFRYLSLFPKDSKLDKDEIVLQWMSQGFLQPKGKKVEEDIGYGYFNELLQRSILQKTDDVYIMHDLIHDLAQDVAKDEYLLITTLPLPEIDKSIRHVSLYLEHSSKTINWRPLFKAKQLRTFILTQKSGVCNEDRIGEFCKNLKCLRTLILQSNLLSSRLSSSIGGLKHLRFFGIGSLCLWPIPNSMYDLYHLQTLVIDQPNLDVFHKQLSSRIGDLINLRHWIIVTRGFGISHPQEILPAEVGRLINLRTVPCLYMGDEDGQFNVRHLENLTNLRGHICLYDLRKAGWSDVTPPQRAYLSTTAGIEELSLHWHFDDFYYIYEENALEVAERVLEYLRPHPNLRQLVIKGYPGGSFPTWIGDASFSRLESLYLEGCPNCTTLPRLFQLPALKHLCISDLSGIKSIGPKPLSSSGPAFAATEDSNGGCGFPSLESLEFELMPEWEEWHNMDESDFPRLVKLTIYDCPQLRRLPSLPSLTGLSFIGKWNPEVLSAACLPVLRVMKINFYRGDSLYFGVPASQWLQSVEELYIGLSDELMCVTGLSNLLSLRCLTIFKCPKLHISPNEDLPKDVQIVYK